MIKLTIAGRSLKFSDQDAMHLADLLTRAASDKGNSFIHTRTVGGGSYSVENWNPSQQIKVEKSKSGSLTTDC